MSNWDWAKAPLDKISAEQVNNWICSTEPNKFLIIPPSAGAWLIGSGKLKIYVPKRPRWLTRFLMKWLVEWEWEDKI